LDFSNAEFMVGSGTLHLLANGGGPLYPAEIFNPDELPGDRTVEFPPVRASGVKYGHVNLLARTGPGKWVYLGGDCCHDPRILSGECGIAMYDDGRGGLRSVHVDTDEAAATVKRIQGLLKHGKVSEEGGGIVRVEVVVAHDGVWREKNRGRFWPGKL
jgi:hypothetical protein